MFDIRPEFMLPCGMPARDFDGRRIRGGVPFDQVGAVVALHRTRAIVRAQAAFYLIELEDLRLMDGSYAFDCGRPAALSLSRRKLPVGRVNLLGLVALIGLVAGVLAVLR